MCTTNALQRHIARRTNNGDLIVNFLADTVEGKYTDAKYHHKLEAIKHLIRFGFSGEEPSHEEKSHFWGLLPTPEELAASQSRHSHAGGNPEGQGGDTENSKLKTVNSLDILNYEIAHLIRTETADGHTIAEFLSDVMTRRDRAFTPKKLRIRHTDRMAAAREILRRGFGHFGRKRKLVADDHDDNNHDTNDYDTLHTDLAKRMREYSEHGTDAVRFLLDVMEDVNPDEPYTWHHRMSAAHELLRRGWDTNYDAITPEMLQDYWRDQQSTRLSVGQKKHLAGLPVSLDDYDQYDNTDYQAIAQAIREQEDLDAEDREAIKNRRSRENRNPEERSWEENPLSPRERARVRGNEDTTSTSTTQVSDEKEQDRISSPSSTSMSVAPDTDDKPNCYHEPLNPDDEAAFNYQIRIESGEFKEGEISIVPPSKAAWKAFKVARRQIREIAAAEGVPILPNPLAGTFKRPPIRSP